MSIRMVLLFLVVLGGAGFYWVNSQSQASAPDATTPKFKIIAAAAPLQAGTLLKDADVREKEVASVEQMDGEFPADENSLAELRGAMLRRYLDVGESIGRRDILRPKDRGFLAAVLAPGTRAVSIGVDATTGAAGLISPGDLVDVILSQEFVRGETSAGKRVVAETVLSMVRVIAVDQQITQGAPTTTGLVAANTKIASTVSLQVTPEQAAKIVVAERLGRLTLTVRSIDTDHPASTTLAGDTGKPIPGKIDPPSGSVFGADVSSALSRDEPAATPRLRVIQGDSVSDVTFR